MPEPRQPSRRVRPVDLVLVALWIVCFALSVRVALQPAGFAPVFVTAPGSGGAYPTLLEFRRYAAVEATGLRRGDRLLELEGEDLRGVSPLGFFLRYSDHARTPRDLAVIFERDGVRREGVLPSVSTAMARFLPVTALVFGACALMLLLRAAPSPLVRALFAALMASGFFFASTFYGSRLETTLSIITQSASLALLGPLAVRFYLLFPHGVPPTGRWARYAPWLLAVMGPLRLSRFGLPPPLEIALPGLALGVIALFVAMLALVTRNYRRADPVGRRKLKWFLFGLYCASLPPMVGAALAGFDARFTPIYAATLSAQAFVPIALLISISRFNLFDIDRLISATASYNVLIVGAVGTAFAVVPGIAAAASRLVGVDPWIGQTVLSLTLASLILPAQRWLRPHVERVFFPSRYALDQGVDWLLERLTGCSDPQELTRTLGEGLSQVLQPEGCVVYAPRDNVFAPVFVDGRAVPPAFELGGPLIATLRSRRLPLAFGDSRRGGGTEPQSAFERAALETLDAAVVLPVQWGGTLSALVCLGRRRSGDVYTPTDVRLLGMVAEKVSDELLRFDQAQLIREGREMQDALRSYVPGAIAEQLAEHGDLEAQERIVSVLFVDIRGYTSYAQDRHAAEIFSTVNRYTETVSEVIRKNGGSVVEFNGDGMMAVFGAPHGLPDKERAAVESARELVRAVGTLHPDGAPADSETLKVGVGVATGEAFVGNIRSVDRLIWSAIGNTTNLAARLQQLSKDLDATVVIDATTHQAAGPVAADFGSVPSLSIRGRRDPVDVYALGAVRA